MRVESLVNGYLNYYSSSDIKYGSIDGFLLFYNKCYERLLHKALLLDSPLTIVCTQKQKNYPGT